MNDVQVVYSGTSGTIGINAKVLGLAALFYGLPGQEMEDLASKQWIGPSNMPATPSEVVITGQYCVVLPSRLTSEEQRSCSTSPENRNHGTAHIYNEAFDMLNPPEISGSLKTKLHIDPEIEKHLGNDRHIKFALNNVINIISDLSKNLGFDYRVDAYLRGNEYSDGWERMELIIEFPDEHYDDIAEYWKKVSIYLSDFYKSLQSIPEFSDEIIARIRKSIYIIVRSEE
jgi:hypothetical protein